jgi:hypothetical protein
MPNLVIRGTYHVKGREPDGDSIAFKADNALLWDQLVWKDARKKPTPARNKPVQLRIEAIDALETHYEGYSQPKAIAKSATHQLMTAFGVKALTYNLNFTNIIQADDGMPGAIVTKGLDGYDRPIAFALLGDHGLADGTVLASLGEDLVRRTVNHKLAAEGQVYPTFYKGMDATALAVISRAVADAIDLKRGIWTFDRSPGFTFWEPRTIYEDVVILPKLFRRLVNFADSNDAMDQLAAWAARKTDKFTVISTGQSFTKFGDLLEIDRRDVGMKFDPLDVLFDPD